MLRESVRNKCFWISWIILPFLIAAAFVCKPLVARASAMELPCIWFYCLGFYCPGCGGTRAVEALLNGQILLSLWYHPLVVYMCGMYLYYLASGTAERVLRRFSTNDSFKGLAYRNGLLYLMIGIVAVNFAVKNILLLVFHIYL